MLLRSSKIQLPLKLILSTIFSVSTICQAEVYRSERPDGTVEYSDQPGTNGQQIEVKPLPIINLPIPSNAPVSQPEAVDSNYTLTIVAPAHDTTIRNSNEALIITASINPPLKPAHQIRLTLDGSPATQLGKSTQFTLNTLHRGSHQIAAQIVNTIGKTIHTSPSVTVHVFRQSANHK